MTEVQEGQFSTGVPFLRLGAGPPLLIASGLTAKHANPEGSWRKMSLAWAEPFAERFTVYLANRRPGLEPGTTMADLAADYAQAVEDDLGEPVHVHGSSTGGSIALQLAADRPELVRRLVVCAAACRLSDQGRHVVAEVARRTEAGDDRRATALMFGTGVPKVMAPVARAAGWALGKRFAVDDPSDMVATLRAEEHCDNEPRLAEVVAPALVLGGSDDRFYSADLFRRTADGMPHGRLVLFDRKAHTYVAGAKAPAATSLEFLSAG